MSRYLMCALTVLALLAPVWAAEVEIADDRMLVVKGERVFVLGLYENPDDDAELARVAEAGFNLVRARADREALDRLHARGLWAWLNTGGAINVAEPPGGHAKQLRDMAAQYGPHPALLVWEVPDEALWNCWYRATQWRRGAEPDQQRERIAALEDRDLARELQRDLDRVQALYHTARLAEADALANAIWRRLGEEPPRPELGLGNAQERAEALCAGMLRGYELLRKLDPAHPVWMNHAPRNALEQLAAFNHAADIVGCDIYPVPFSPLVGHSDLRNRSVSAVGDYTRRMQAAAPEKPVWMVLQGFGWGDIQPQRSEAERQELRRPTLQETRFMAFDAIVRGARGILYWGTHAIEKDSRLWNDLLAFAGEINQLRHVLAAPDAAMPVEVELEPTWGSLDRGLVVLPKQVGDATWLLVVNEWTGPLAYSLRGLGALEGVRYREWYSEAAVTVADGALPHTIADESVQIWCPE